MTTELVFPGSVMLVGLHDISYYPASRIARQFGRNQYALIKDHAGYTCPLFARAIERVQSSWENRSRMGNLRAPTLVSPPSSYYDWLARDLENAKRVEPKSHRKRKESIGEGGSSKRIRN